MTQLAPVPRVPEPPFIGSAFAFQRDPLGLFARIGRACGDVGAFHVGPLRFVFVNTPALIEELYLGHADDLEKGSVVQAVFRPMLGASLFNVDGAAHARQRKLLAPRFAAADLARHTGAIVAAARRHALELASGARVDLLAALTRLGREAFGTALFSEAGALGPETRLGQAFAVGLASIDFALAHPLYPPSPVPTLRNLRYRRAGRVFQEELRLRAEARAGAPGDDLLGLLLSLRYDDGGAMTPVELAAELAVMCGAHEIVAVALAWTILELTRNPAIYDRLCAEVDAALGGRAPGAGDLARLPLTVRIWKEGLRKHPPTPGLIRAALRPFSLAGHAIKKGDLVSATPYLLHRRPDLHPEPERFDPDRFLPERAARLPRLGYIPFGVGNRSCLGEHLAGLEGPLALATLAQTVRFAPADAAPLEAEVMFNIQPRGGRFVVGRPR